MGSAAILLTPSSLPHLSTTTPYLLLLLLPLPAYFCLAAEVRWWWGGKRCGNSGYGGSGPRDGAVAVTVGAVGMVDFITYYVQ